MLDQLPKQERTVTKQAQVIKDRDLERIITGYKKNIAQDIPNNSTEERYQRASTIAPEATQEQIQAYIYALTEQTNATGLYISALINNNKQEELTLTLPTPYNHIGYKHQHPNTTIQGDTGKFTTWKMRGGKLTIQGNTGEYTAWDMSDGDLTIQRNTGDRTAWRMSGGKLTIHGDPGQHLGVDATSKATINLRTPTTPHHTCKATINTTPQ